MKSKEISARKPAQAASAEACRNALVVKGGTVFTASDTFQADILVRGGKIAAIADVIAYPGAQVVDASGLEVYPGGVDVHTHFELPFMGTVSADDFESGTIAAACGGTTTIIDFVIPSKGRGLLEALETWRGKAAGKAAVDYGFHMALVEYDDRVASELPEVVREGITSFKCFMAYKGAFMMDDSQLLDVLAAATRVGGLVSVHAENGDMLVNIMARLLKEGKTGPAYHPVGHPAAAEGEAAHRAIALAKTAGAPLYFVHLSCNEALEEVKAARLAGQCVLAETCPQYLLLDESLYRKNGFEAAKWVMSPPLRDKSNQCKLWQGLADGFIQGVATDHCSFRFSGQKDMGKDDFTKIPNGIPAVGDRVNLLYTYGAQKGRLSRNQFAAVTATNPAKIFGLYPQKGTIAIGSDADLALFDPKKKGVISKETARHRVDYSAFEGFELEGSATVVISRGEVVAKDNVFAGRKGRGAYVRRKEFDGGAWR
ncbi:MAG: dihydropyrimidinase [Elusimicrobia bacterium]|nr:dihydropyrimidinase [Elusimicrobiota bacterium]